MRKYPKHMKIPFDDLSALCLICEAKYKEWPSEYEIKLDIANHETLTSYKIRKHEFMMKHKHKKGK